MSQNGYSADELEIARISKAISHPARVAIIKFLLEQNNCICGDIVSTLPLSQSTVSQHLKALKEAEIIKGEVDGPKTCYCINETVWKNASEFIIPFLNRSVASTKCC